jgi:hypothetical protein
MLFPSIKRLLDKQEITHRTAGEFLHTLKTLMAKLKVLTFFLNLSFALKVLRE